MRDGWVGVGKWEGAKGERLARGLGGRGNLGEVMNRIFMESRCVSQNFVLRHGISC